MATQSQNQTKSQVTTLDDSNDVDVAVAPASGAIKGANFDASLSGLKKTVTIHADGTESGNDAVFVGINGFGYQIPRGKPFEVPVEVIKVLEDAKMDILSPVPGGGVAVRSTPRYAFSVN